MSLKSSNSVLGIPQHVLQLARWRWV